MQYVIGKDEETNEIELIGRLGKEGVAEIWRNNKWISENGLYRDLHDGLLTYISEVEAMKLIKKQTTLQQKAA